MAVAHRERLTRRYKPRDDVSVFTHTPGRLEASGERFRVMSKPVGAYTLKRLFYQGENKCVKESKEQVKKTKRTGKNGRRKGIEAGKE